MKTKLKNTETNELTDALILPASLKDMPVSWNFNWVELFKSGGKFFKLVLTKTPDIIEGILMVTLIDNALVYINNVESAPQNIGNSKKYDFVAGCLLAYACQLSFELGKKDYNGFVSFDSKSKLIPVYCDKYGATHIGGQKMYFSPEAGKKLIKKYLEKNV